MWVQVHFEHAWHGLKALLGAISEWRREKTRRERERRAYILELLRLLPPTRQEKYVEKLLDAELGCVTHEPSPPASTSTVVEPGPPAALPSASIDGDHAPQGDKREGR